ncbi:MAG: Glu/Leu/Phe/Val dehydrogenase dimerization domain-containing protein [Bacteroidia bacterium]
MISKLKEFEYKQPEIVFNWKDSETEAEGWVVINSLRNGAAGGGTRMRKGCSMNEVLSLAKTMEIKFCVAGPSIGGAKSGINFDPNDPRKDGVLKRWYKAVAPLLKNYYGTGGDLNIDEIKEVIPITSSFGILHPQEGVVNGHFNPDDATRKLIIKQLQDGVTQLITDKYYTPDVSQHITVADMITGFGVSEAVRHYYKIWGKAAEGKRVIVQGFGNVGAAAAWEMAKHGYKVVGIIDRSGAIIKPEGLSLEEITHLFLTRNGNMLQADNLIPFDQANLDIWGMGAEVFLPCAASRLVTHHQLDTMIENGLEVISSGANVPFNDAEIFLGETAIHADNSVAVLPDFIANCGMARAFAYFMQPNTSMRDADIFEDTSHIIEQALHKTYLTNPEESTQIWQNSLAWVLDELLNKKQAVAS